MQDVRVIGVESGALLLATDAGSEFRLAVTSSLPGQVRQANPDGTPLKRVSPKDVQARIRSGASAEQVAEALDVDVEYVRRFEGPVLAERAFILDAAHRVPVTPGSTGDPDTFGEAITERLESGEASDVRWSSWKHVENGWQVQVHYAVGEVAHDAQWHFDPKTSTLSPENGDAHRLSHSEEDEGLTPRLRAVEYAEHDSTRFDSGAFQVDAVDDAVLDPDIAEPRALRAPLPRIGAAPVEERAPGNETADLLEALRRRRGEREAASFADHDGAGSPRATGQVNVVDIPLDFGEPEDDTLDEPSSSTTGQRPVAELPTSAPALEGQADRPERKKRPRRSMPSWDEIVFGTRPDDDLA
jgi:hypothetical protein